MEAIDIISAEVRERIRARTLDPRTDASATRDLVREVIAEYDERTLSGTLPIITDKDETARHIFDEVSGFGALQRYLDDTQVEEMWLNSGTAGKNVSSTIGNNI